MASRAVTSQIADEEPRTSHRNGLFTSVPDDTRRHVSADWPSPLSGLWSILTTVVAYAHHNAYMYEAFGIKSYKICICISKGSDASTGIIHCMKHTGIMPGSSCFDVLGSFGGARVPQIHKSGNRNEGIVPEYQVT